LPPCPRKWRWKPGNGGFPGLLPFPADRLEMTSGSLLEIRETAISACPLFPPPTGDRPSLNVVGQPRAVGAETTAGSAVSSSAFGSKISSWQSPTDRNHPLPEWPTFPPKHLSGCFRPTRSSGRLWSTGCTSRRISRRPSREFPITRSKRTGFLGPQSARDQDGPRLAHRG
jgi:hypothetical protein